MERVLFGGDGWSPSTWLREAAECHSRNLDERPVYAHYSVAALALGLGLVMGSARGAVFAISCPPGDRLRGFLFATRSTVPLYAIPFVIGTQLDCFEATMRRRGRGRPSVSDFSSGAADLG